MFERRCCRSVYLARSIPGPLQSPSSYLRYAGNECRRCRRSEVFFLPRCSVVAAVRIDAIKQSPIKDKEVHKATVGGTWLITRFPASGAVVRVRARRRRDHGRPARCDRPRFATTQSRLASERRRSRARRPLALEDGLPHFQFLVLRGIFGKL